MLKSISIILVLLSIAVAAQTPKATFIKEVQVERQWVIWHSYVIDSTWWMVWTPTGDLPRRENGTYKYWMEDSSGNLIPIRYIKRRIPILNDEPSIYIMNKEDMIFNSDPDNPPRIDIDKYRNER